MYDWNDKFLEELNRTTCIKRKLLAQKEQEEKAAEAAAMAAAAKQQRDEYELRSLQNIMSKKVMISSITAILLMAVIFLLTAIAVYTSLPNPTIYVGIGVLIPTEFYLITKVVEYLNKGRFIQ